jgi:cytidylate kinase
MSRTSSARNLAAALVQAGSYGQVHEQGVPPGTSPALTIAFSREVGARGTSVASEVGERLGWPVYDHSLLEHIAKEMNLRTQLLESIDERRRSWVLETIEGFSALPGVSEGAFVRHLVHTVLSLAAHGSCIIVGRGAPHILPPATTLRVRLVSSLEDRVRAIVQERGLSYQEAARFVEEVGRERVRFIKDHFQKDPTAPENYDLILNASRFSVAHCAELVIEALHRLQARGIAEGSLTPRSQK